MGRKLPLLILLLGCFAACDFTTAEEYFQMANDYSTKGDDQMALYYIEKVLEKQPNYRRALYNRATFRANLDDWEGSTNDYLEIIKNDPQNTEVLANIADNYDYLKDYDKSIQYYTLALASDRVVKTDTSQRIRLSLGALMNDPDPDTDYEMEEIDLYFNRGVTHLKYEKWDEAVVDFNKTLELGAYPESSYLALGEAYLGKKDSINTCRVLIEAAKLGSNEARELLKENCI